MSKIYIILLNLLIIDYNNLRITTYSKYKYKPYKMKLSKVAII